MLVKIINLSYPLNIDIWKNPGKTKDNMVQQVAPTNTISLAKIINLSYPLNIDIWNSPGKTKANMVQQVAPTNAIRLAKLGISITIVPVIITIVIRRKF